MSLTNTLSHKHRSLTKKSPSGLITISMILCLLLSSIMNSMFLPDCTEEEISKIMNELQNVKSSDIPILVIKKCSPVLSPILATHFNDLMRIGEFPGGNFPSFQKG